MSLLPPRVFWPLVVVLGQILLLFAAWGFYTATAIKPVALPESTAERAARSASAVTLIVTLLSTVIAVGSSYLYSHSVRYALTTHLVNPMPLHRLALGIKIARARPLLTSNVALFGWMVVTLINVGILGAQTAAWNTLLTPRRIFIGYGATGSGINITAPQFVSFAGRYINDPTWQAPDNILTVSSVMQASGVAAVNAEFGLPAVINFNDVSFVNATRGIMPAFLEDTPSSLETRTHFPASVHVDTMAQSLHGFNTNITLIQQGLTADVECQQRDPSLHRVRALVGRLPSPEEIIGMTYVMDVDCPDGSNQSTWAMTRVFPPREDGDAVLTYMCPTSTDSNSPVRELVIHGQGQLYDFIGTLSCMVTPKVTTVEVNYASSTGFHNLSSTTFTTVSPPLLEENIETLDEVMGPFVFLARHLVKAQVLAGNDFGNVLSQFYFHDSIKSQEVLQSATAAYITGVFEFGATLLRAEFTRNGTSYWPDQGIPEPLMYNYEGTYTVETMGWDNRTSPLVPILLIIPTLVAFAAILFVASTISWADATGQGPMEPKQCFLDLGEFLHVMAVSYPESKLPSLDQSESKFLERCKELSARLDPGSDADGIRPNPSSDTNRIKLEISDWEPSPTPNKA